MTTELGMAAAAPVSGPTVETAAAPMLGAQAERLVSLDVLRGITIAGMILVNNPGSWSKIFGPLEHAPWDGCTPTDLVFPFFLFMVGVAMTLSFDRRLARGASRGKLFGHVVARSIVLILLGWVLSGFPNLRLISPFLLMITGLQLLTREPSPPVQQGTKDRIAGNTERNPRERVWWLLSWASLIAGVVWWLIDFRYFNGPTARGAFTDWWPTTPGGKNPLRVPGVLPRIGFCYFLASIVVLNTRWLGRIIWAVILMLAYWASMVYVHAPAGYVVGNGAPGISIDARAGAPFPGTLNDWLDVRLLGRHLYSSRPDPEGLLSSIPAVATILIGTLIGTWILRKDLQRIRKALGLVAAAALLVIAGLIWDHWFPINKKIWTSSYVLYTGGLASGLLALCYCLCDIQGWRRWSVPFVVLGTNAIVAFFGSGLVARLMGMIKWGEPDHETTLRGWLYAFYQSAFVNVKDGRWVSLAWAISYVALWVLLLVPLYRKRIFVRV